MEYYEGGIYVRRIFKRILSLLMITIVCTQFIIVPEKAQAGISEGFIGEIRLFAGNFAPKGWAFCQGQLIPLSQNTALFSILGTTYGGDGKSTFALPDLQGRVPIGAGHGPGLSERFLGETGGVQEVTLIGTEVPSHKHGNQLLKFDLVGGFGTIKGYSGKGMTSVPGLNTVMAPGIRNEKVYSDDTAAASINMMANSAQVNTTGTMTAYTSPVGGGLPHNNMSPYLAMNYIICTQGTFPYRDGYGSGDGYTGEIKMFAGNFEPSGWIFCNGRNLSIAENEMLFNLIGTTYGGDGQDYFNLPDLRGRAPIGMGQGLGSNYILGQMGGTETETLTLSQIPSHNHTISQQTQNLHLSGNMSASGNTGDSALPEGNVLAVGARNERIYSTGFNASMKEDSFSMNLSISDASADIGSSYYGGSQPHENMMPYAVINYVINPGGIYPSPTGSSQSDNYMGFIEMYAFNFAPGGKALCNGQALPINQNQALFSLLGTTYGGNGVTNFTLPNLRGRAALCEGNGFTLGQPGGEEAHTLTQSQMPNHVHAFSKDTTVTGMGTVSGTNASGNKTLPGNSV
ncbi:MAG: phage tail protein, partial [Clostridiales bacterium]|nr:phage tail protein [Clostridiales bacterium]